MILNMKILHNMAALCAVQVKNSIHLLIRSGLCLWLNRDYYDFFRYGAIRGGYQHFGAQGGQDSGFPSPRSALGYPFPPMHQNSYSGYHLGSYAPPCSSPPKDGK